MTGLLTNYIGSGTLADRPETPDIALGAFGFYQDEDTGNVYKWNPATPGWALLEAPTLPPDTETGNFNWNADSQTWVVAEDGGPSLPTGGTTGQFLAKTSDSDGDANWVDAPEGGGGGGDSEPISARYWRILFPASASHAYAIAIAEIQMRGVSGGPDLCVGGVPFARGNINSYEPSKAFDDDPATAWAYSSSGGDVQQGISWVGYDFGADVAIVEITMKARSDDALGQFPIQGLVQYSNDGVMFFDAGGYGLNADLPTGNTIVFPTMAIQAAAGGGGGGGDSSIGAHRYWALMDISADHDFPQMQAIKWMEGATRHNVVDYKASTEYNGSYPADSLLDDTGTYWAAAHQWNAWLSADFTNPVSIDKVSILPVNAALTQAPFVFSICYSDDGISWIPACKCMKLASEWAADTWADFAVPTTR